MGQKKKINKKFIIIISLLVIIGGTYGVIKIVRGMSHEVTDDAQIDANMSPIIPHVGGYIAKVYVKDNASVKKGDTLFTLDKKDYNIQVEQARANLAAAESNLSVASAAIHSSIANASVVNSQKQTATKNIELEKIKLWRATNDFERYKNLYANHSITAQQFEQAQAAKQSAEKALAIAKNKVKTATDQHSAADSQTQISKKQIAVAKAQVKSAQALLDAALLNIDYTVITAPISGQLSTVKLQTGQFVQAGQALLYLVNTSDKWVIANFKETQLQKMKIGQKVSIQVDAYSDTEFEGIVETFSPATGSKFSLLPADNATGNFVKTIQRLPVKITFTTANKPEAIQKLRAGMNAVVDVHLK